ncbi:MAG TPA: hypothetical protein VGB50_07295 [Flavobacterium sp.]|jgi:hypothetical protein
MKKIILTIFVLAAWITNTAAQTKTTVVEVNGKPVASKTTTTVPAKTTVTKTTTVTPNVKYKKVHKHKKYKKHPHNHGADVRKVARKHD